MARFDVYRHPRGRGCLLDVQSNVISALKTRVVIPLLPPSDVPQPIPHLHPQLLVGGERLLLATQLLGVVSNRGSAFLSPA